MNFWDFLAALGTRIIDRFSERAFFGLLIIGSFVLAMGTLAYNAIPDGKNSELFGQGLVALIGAVGIIVGAIWKTSQGERQNQETLNELVKSSPPISTENKDTTNDQPRADGAAGNTCPCCGNRRVDDAVADRPFVPHAIPDSIPGL